MAYIALEGGEGSGKSTQARLLAERLDAVVTREPGGTELGAQLRAQLLEPGRAPVSPRAETLLMAADRAQHVDELVRPTLAAGRHVISDRTAYSSLAYQGGGRELGVDAVRAVNDWALDGCWPDIVILLDLDRSSARYRLARGLDRLEQEGEGFHERVRTTYLELAADNPSWHVIDADAEIDVVSTAVWAVVEPLVTSCSS